MGQTSSPGGSRTAGAAAASPAADFYVAPGGNDAWSGALASPNAARSDGPFATLARARDAVRQKRASNPDHPFTVQIRGGVYQLAETLAFAPEDSGTEATPVVYEAYPGEKPVISGGRAITGWKKGDGNLWTAEIPDVKAGKWYFHQLFVNGERRQRARTPNEGYLRTNGPLVEYVRDKKNKKFVPESQMGFKFKDGDLKQFHNLEDVNIMAYHSWNGSLHWIARLDEAKHEVHYTNSCGWPMSWWEHEQRYVVDNVREGLDSPGEWYLDRKSGVLSYWPMPGEDVAKAGAVGSCLVEVVRFDGDWEKDRLVHDIVLRGLSIQHAEWVEQRDKQMAGQSNTFLTSALLARGAERLSIERCEIAHTGGYALSLEAGCKNNRVFHCEMRDLGGGGVRIGEFFRQKSASKNPDETKMATPELTIEGTGPRDTGHNVVDNNFIHNAGVIFPSGTPVIIGHSAYNRVSHNEICDTPYIGVSVGWVWGFGKSAAHHNEITDNHIHHYGLVMSDLGAIYTLGPSPGTRIAHNLCHDAHRLLYGGWGIYTDEGSSEITIENNVAYDVQDAGFHQHYGRNNVVRNNVFAFSRDAAVVRSREDLPCHFSLEHNIIYCDNDEVLGKVWKNNDYHVDSNLYWIANGEQGLFGGKPFAKWQATGQDAHSLIADPLFADPAKRDFRLQPGSPAEKIGFKPIEMTGFGLYGEPEWVEAPKKTVRKEIGFLPSGVAETIDDGFEDTEVGQKAKSANITGEDKTGGASIRVTDKAAAPGGGKRSLKVTDAPGLAQPYSPLMSYKINFKSGLVRGSFDVRMGQGAILWHEWRDGPNPYNVGPSLRIEANGDLLASKKKLMTVPRDKWIHVEILCALGKASAGTYELSVKVEGGEAKRFEKLPAGSPEFRLLRWFGFSSMATEKAVFYLDNIHLDAAK